MKRTRHDDTSLILSQVENAFTDSTVSRTSLRSEIQKKKEEFQKKKKKEKNNKA